MMQTFKKNTKEETVLASKTPKRRKKISRTTDEGRRRREQRIMMMSTAYHDAPGARPDSSSEFRKHEFQSFGRRREPTELPGPGPGGVFGGWRQFKKWYLGTL